MKKVITILFIIQMVFVVNGQNFVNYTTSNSELPGNEVRAVFVDEHGNVWFGTNAGLALKKGDGWLVYTSESEQNIIPGNVVTDISYHYSREWGNEIWIATHSGAGVGRYTAEGISTASTYQVGDNGVSLTSNKINAITLDSAGVRYFGTDDGLAAFGQEWYYFSDTTTPKIPDAEIMALDARNDSVYLGMVSGRLSDAPAVARIQNEVDGFTGASTYVTPYNIISGDVYAVYIDKYGYRWYGTNNGTTRHIKMSGKGSGVDMILSTDDGLAGNFVYAITEDSLGNVWFGTDGGLTKMTPSGDFKSYTTEDGLANNTVYDIDFRTKDGTIWVGTAGGVSQLTQAVGINETIRNSDRHNLKVLPSIIRNNAEISFIQLLPGNAALELFSIDGKKVQTVMNKFVPAGNQVLSFSVEHDMQPGIYFFRLNSNGNVAVKKVVILKW